MKILQMGETGKRSGWKLQIRQRKWVKITKNYPPSTKIETKSPTFSYRQQIHPLLIPFSPTSEGVLADEYRMPHQDLKTRFKYIMLSAELLDYFTMK